MSARKRFKQSKLTSFLAVNDEESHSVHQTGASTAGNRSGSADNDSLGSGDGNVNFEKMTTAGTSTGNSMTPQVTIENNDIGQLFSASGGPGPKHVKDDAKAFFLNNAFVPFELEKDWTWPSASAPNGKVRRLASQHFKDYPFLTYSKLHCGLYCKYCVFFSSSGIGKNAKEPGVLINRSFNNWNKITGSTSAVVRHAATANHMASVTFATNFLHCYSNPADTIAIQIDSSRERLRQANRLFMKPIVGIIKIMAQMGISFRGHRDDGTLEMPDSIDDVTTGSGNFRSMLQLVAVGNSDLKEHLQSTSKNTSNKYISKTTQNEIICCIGRVIQSKISSEAREAGMYSLMCDETTDVAGLSQISVCIRYVDTHENKPEIKERLLNVVEADGLDAVSLKMSIFNVLRKCSIDPQKMVGQGYDGASAMSGEFRGVQALVRDEVPHAMYVHCVCHVLNLALCKSSEVPEVRNCFGTLSSIATFFNDSPHKRNKQLHNSIAAVIPDCKKSRLLNLCKTRWVEKHNAVITFCEFYPAICHSLSIIATWRDNAASKAENYLASVRSTKFVIALVTSSHVMGGTKSLFVSLQSSDKDLGEAVSLTESVTHLLSSWRNDFDTLSKWIDEAEGLLGEQLTLPCGHRLTSEENDVNKAIRDFYRKIIILPFLDNLLAELNFRFNAHSKSAFAFSKLLPVNIPNVKGGDFVCLIEKMKEIAQSFWRFVDLGGSLSDELELWKTTCSQLTVRPETALHSLSLCNSLHFPTVHALLKIFSTIPISSCSAERSFSAMKLLKTKIRSCMGETRMSSLLIAYCTKDVPVTSDEILDEFAKSDRKILL